MAKKTIWLRAGTAKVRIGVGQKTMTVQLGLPAGLSKRLSRWLKNKTE